MRTKEEHEEYLKLCVLPYGTKVYFKVLNRSRTSGSQTVSVYTIKPMTSGDVNITDITESVSRVTSFRLNKKGDGLLLGGHGYCKIQHIAECLGNVLYPETEAKGDRAFRYEYL